MRGQIEIKQKDTIPAGDYRDEIIYRMYVAGRKVGSLEVCHLNEPEGPYYYLQYLEISTRYRSCGYASEAVKWVNQTIRRNSGIGFLINCIAEPEARIRGLYERHGWQRIENQPENILFYLGREESPSVFLRKAKSLACLPIKI